MVKCHFDPSKQNTLKYRSFGKIRIKCFYTMGQVKECQQCSGKQTYSGEYFNHLVCKVLENIEKCLHALKKYLILNNIYTVYNIRMM